MNVEKEYIDSERKSYILKLKDKLKLEKNTINMIGYCRVSTQLQAKFGSSIETQINLLIEDCKREHYDENGKTIKYVLLRIYVDEGISAKNITDRHGFLNLQAYLTSLVTGKTYNKLGFIISDISRLTRSSSDLESIISWISDNSLKLKFIDSSLDVTSSSGMLMLKMMTSFFEFERKNSAFKTRLTLRSMSESGTLTGHCSYGWTNGINENGRKINVPVEQEQEGLNEVIRIYREDEELSASQIKKLMNRSGILCYRGPGQNTEDWTGLWTTKIINKIIEHEKFIDRQLKYKELSKHTNIMNKDDIVVQLIRDYLDEIDGYDNDKFNYTEIAKIIDDKYCFQKQLSGSYIKKMMIKAKIINESKIIDSNINLENKDRILDSIKELILENSVSKYSKLCELMIQNNIDLLGKIEMWTSSNVRSLCLRNKITLINKKNKELEDRKYIPMNDKKVIKFIKKLLIDNEVTGYTHLTQLINEANINPIGKRKIWNPNNVRSLCLDEKIDIFSYMA